MENFYFDLSKCKRKPLLLSLVRTADSISKELSITFSPGSSSFCFLDFNLSRRCLSRSPGTRFSSRPLALSSRKVATFWWPRFWVGTQSGSWWSHSLATFPEINVYHRRSLDWKCCLCIEIFPADHRNPFVSPLLGTFPYFFSSTSTNWRYSCHINSFISATSGPTAKNRALNLFSFLIFFFIINNSWSYVYR